MATLHVTQADAARDFAALLHKVQQGDEVLIERDGECIAVLAAPEAVTSETDSKYDAIVSSKLEEALNDPRPSLDSDTVEAHFAKRRQGSTLQEFRIAG